VRACLVQRRDPRGIPRKGGIVRWLKCNTIENFGNDQWRVVFRWLDGRATGVTVEDYHR
jgi:hypothetical protein